MGANGNIIQIAAISKIAANFCGIVHSMIEASHLVNMYFNICRIRNDWYPTWEPMGTHQMATVSKMAAKTLYKIDKWYGIIKIVFLIGVELIFYIKSSVPMLGINNL